MAERLSELAGIVRGKQLTSICRKGKRVKLGVILLPTSIDFDGFGVISGRTTENDCSQSSYSRKSKEDIAMRHDGFEEVVVESMQGKMDAVEEVVVDIEPTRRSLQSKQASMGLSRRMAMERRILSSGNLCTELKKLGRPSNSMTHWLPNGHAKGMKKRK
jgi:hypothetical protein